MKLLAAAMKDVRQELMENEDASAITERLDVGLAEFKLRLLEHDRLEESKIYTFAEREGTTDQGLAQRTRKELENLPTRFTAPK
jgi:hypothetical protein